MKKALRLALVSSLVAAGLAVLGLVAYSYFFVERTGRVRVRGETALNASQRILHATRGKFLDKTVALDPTAPPAPQLGSQAPDFTLSDLEGNATTLSQLRGRPVLLNFWATWCPPCRKEMPDLQRFYEKYGDKIQLLGVNWDFNSVGVEPFLDRHGITYPNVMDPKGEVFVRYRLTGLPVSFWLDPEGFVRGVWLGAMSEADILAGFQKTVYALEAR